MKTFSKNITLLLTSMFLLSLPLMAQKGSTPKDLAKQEKAIRKKIKECEKDKWNGVITLTFDDPYPFSKEAGEIWNQNNNTILRNWPDIIYIGYKYDYKLGDYKVRYYIIPLQESNTFHNQSSAFSEMNKHGAGYFYVNSSYRTSDWWGKNRIVEGEEKFYVFYNINWSGGIKNGNLDGEGEGYYVKDGILYFVKGTFDEGSPKGNCTFGWLRLFNPNTLRLKYDDIRFGPFNGGFAQMTKSDEEGKVLYVDKGFGIFDINESLAHIHYQDQQKGHWGGWSKSTIKSFTDNSIVTTSTYTARDGVNGKYANIIDSIRMEIFVNAGGVFTGLTESGKQSLLEYYKGIIPIAEKLFKVFNTQEVKDPINNLKTHYNFDIQQLKNKLTTVEHLPEDIPQADLIYKANPNISKKIDMGKDLYSIYELLETDYYKKDLGLNVAYGKSSFMKDKAEMATEKLNALMNNPLFPHKNQAVANAIKSKLASVVDSYAKDYAIAYKELSAQKSAAADSEKEIRRIIETYDIPKIKSCEKKYDKILGWYYAYTFEDGIGGIIYIQKGTSFYMVGTGGKIDTAYKTLRDAECALYFYKKYGKERQTGQPGY